MNAGIIIQRAFDIIMIIMIIIEEIEKNNYCIRSKIIRLQFTCIVWNGIHYGTVRYELELYWAWRDSTLLKWLEIVIEFKFIRHKSLYCPARPSTDWSIIGSFDWRENPFFAVKDENEMT